MISSNGFATEPGTGPRPETQSPVGEGVGLGASDQTTTTLRRKLIEAEHKVKLWKEQADEARAEYVHCKSNVKVLQTELESLRKHNSSKNTGNASSTISNLIITLQPPLNSPQSLVAAIFRISSTPLQVPLIESPAEIARHRNPPGAKVSFLQHKIREGPRTTTGTTSLWPTWYPYTVQVAFDMQ